MRTHTFSILETTSIVASTHILTFAAGAFIAPGGAGCHRRRSVRIRYGIHIRHTAVTDTWLCPCGRHCTRCGRVARLGFVLLHTRRFVAVHRRDHSDCGLRAQTRTAAAAMDCYGGL